MYVLQPNSKRLRGTAAKLSKWRYSGPERPVDINGAPLPMAVAMVAQCVKHYRAQAAKQAAIRMPVTKALKVIYLKPRLWNEFETWYKDLAQEKEAYMEVLMVTYLGVEVKEGSKLSMHNIYWDFYPFDQAKA